MSKLPEHFSEFSEARQRGFLAIKDLKDQKERVVGLFCAFTPVEIPMAAGAAVVGVCGTSEEPIPDAERVLPRNLCPMVKSSYGHAITDTCPYIYFSDMLIGETTCDGKKKMYEYLAREKPMHIMKLPNTARSQSSLELWRSEMIKLKMYLEDFYGIEITEEQIRQAIKDKNEERRLLNEFFELGKLDPPAVYGRSLYSVTSESQFIFDREEVKHMIRRAIDSAKEVYEKSFQSLRCGAPRILITGSPMGGADKKIVDVIEQSGGQIVAYEMCGAIRSTSELVDEGIEDVYEALARKYINIGCSCMSENDTRMEMLDSLIDQYRIDGVIDISLQACHTFNIESFRVQKLASEKKGVQFMHIETDYSTSDTEQLRTRLEAFIEML